MKLSCIAVVTPEFSEVVRLATVSIEQDMMERYRGEDFGGGIDLFSVGVYVGDFKSSVVMREAKENHGTGLYEDFHTKEKLNYLSIVIFIGPDLARGKSQNDLKYLMIEKVFKIFDNFDIKTPEIFKVEDLFSFLKKCFGKS